MSSILSKLNKNDAVFAATQTILDHYTKLLHRVADMEDENKSLKAALAQFEMQQSFGSRPVSRSPIDKLSPIQMVPTNASYDDIKFTSGENSSTSGLDVSELCVTPPSVSAIRRTKTYTSTPHRLNADKENVPRAVHSSKSNGEKAPKVKTKHNDHNASAREVRWLSKSSADSSATAFKKPDRFSPPQKKLAMPTADNNFQFSDETNTIPPSFEALTSRKTKLPLQLKQSKIHFPKTSQAKATTNDLQAKKIRLQQSDETFFEDVSAVNIENIFDDDAITDKPNEIMGGDRRSVEEEETYCEGLSLPDSKLRQKHKNITTPEPGNKRASPLSTKNQNNSDVFALSAISDDVIVIPDSMSTQDMFQEMDKKGEQLLHDKEPQREKPYNRPKPPSPPPKHTAPAKSNEPAFGCDECADYYRMMGPAAIRRDKNGKQHMCLNQRRKIGVPDTPPGFWNPKIPLTPENERVPPKVDYRFSKNRPT